MGDPKKTKNIYRRPRKRWSKTRIETERKPFEEYGLKNKKELWITESLLRKKRQNARDLLALPLEQRLKREKELVDSLKVIGMLGKDATLENVLGMKLEELLERRLQTIVLRKGLANTAKQARQFITHGHIAINKKKITVPGYIVRKGEEEHLTYYGKPIVLKQEKPKEKPMKEEKEKEGFEKEEIEEKETKRKNGKRKRRRKNKKTGAQRKRRKKRKRKTQRRI